MTLEDFISDFDKENAVNLLGGKRKVLPEDKDLLIRLGKVLATKTKKMRFRSGNADGADYYFSLGVSAVDKTRLEVITPYSAHRKKTNVAYDTISLDDINLASEPEVVYQSKGNKKTEKLVDQYVSGERDRISMKAAFIIRDTVMVIGTDNISPATFAIFYDDLHKPKTGGTGYTMNVCKQNHIPFIDQRIWFEWLKD
ncbi:hypothetical protein [Olivibacter sitiensis]|uniref:hypothetical protein n=1 Tax=Olivibacter sitiensis TaxID=376470 RepID=UPI00041264D7|nr:hypothetical protein [Olivibacter sitiensis]